MKTWIQQHGLNPRVDWEIDWDEELQSGPVAVAFEPFDGVWPIFCTCYEVEGEYAVLKVPPKTGKDESVEVITEWFREPEECWIIVPEIFIRPQ